MTKKGKIPGAERILREERKDEDRVDPSRLFVSTERAKRISGRANAGTKVDEDLLLSMPRARRGIGTERRKIGRKRKKEGRGSSPAPLHDSFTKKDLRGLAVLVLARSSTRHGPAEPESAGLAQALRSNLVLLCALYGGASYITTRAAQS